MQSSPVKYDREAGQMSHEFRGSEQRSFQFLQRRISVHCWFVAFLIGFICLLFTPVTLIMHVPSAALQHDKLKESLQGALGHKWAVGPQ